ncbi:MAG TPA: methionine aminotransferase [Chitinophagaceae bacterium]|nr:methionine aminotransferase [Chitinophagaceae bacterium]
MSNLAKQTHAINLAQGFPDYDISHQLAEYVKNALDKGHNQYAPMIGVESLRLQLAEKIQSLYQKAIDYQSEITITPGATYTIYCALTTILSPLDEVIILEPAYDSYIPNILLNGAIPIPVKLVAPAYSIDWSLVKKAISPKTKAIIINSPHNPSGYVWSKEDIQELNRLATQHDFYIISDEVYEHTTIDQSTHESIIKYPELYQKSYVIFSFGKVFHNTGWKIGYCVAPPHLTEEFRKIHQFLSFSTNTPMQYALADFLQDKNEYLSLSSFFQKKRDFFLEQIKDIPFTIHQKSQGSFFQLASYENISNLKDKEFAIWLTKEIGVATIPVSVFHHDHQDDKLIRFCFAKKESTFIEARNKMQKLI